jgi:hypothetical protein
LKKKQILILFTIVILTFLVGCSATPKVSIGLINPKPVDGQSLFYNEEKLSILFKPLYTSAKMHGILLQIKNKTDNDIKILWDEASFVGVDNTASRVVHKGVKYFSMDLSMPPTIIPANTKTNEAIVPQDNVSFGLTDEQKMANIISAIGNAYTRSNSNSYIQEKWNTTPFGSEQSIGEKVSIVLPMEINGNKERYQFDFLIVVYQTIS